MARRWQAGYPGRGIARFGGLGELTAEQLRQLPATNAAARLTPGALELATRAWGLSLTERVLAGDANHVTLNGIDRSIGGMHLHGRHVRWRWDDGTESIIEER